MSFFANLWQVHVLSLQTTVTPKSAAVKEKRPSQSPLKTVLYVLRYRMHTKT